MPPPAATTDVSLEHARALDDADALAHFRTRFHIPQHEGRDAAYFCGNSLGLQPRSTAYLIQRELDDWAEHGVEGHFRARNPWFSYHKLFSAPLARIVGAEEEEVVAMNQLTVNLHLLMISFYRPTKTRYKIITERGAFPSDQYALETQVKLHGFSPDDAIIEVGPHDGGHTVDEADLLKAIEAAGASLALVMIGGVHYYSGQAFDLKKITESAHAVGAVAGYDLAHAAGNVPLRLHDWDVDFACWCSYKYLNAGPGAVAGAFVHTRHAHAGTFRLGGWWGHDEATRFRMEKGFVPQAGAAGWQMSNAPVFNSVGLLASLDIFDKAGMPALREKSLRLTGYLHSLLQCLDHLPFEIATPPAPENRGCQLSLLFQDRGHEVFDALTAAGVVADWREPSVVRVAPVPLYNTFEDCYRLYAVLRDFR